MKNCPSCAARLESHLKKCTACGYDFPDANANKTMMGLPAVSFPLDDVADGPDPGKQTLFGFPAQKASSFAAFDEEDEEDDSTHLIPASQLQKEFQGDSSQRAQVEPVKEDPREKGVPSMKSAWGLEEDSDGPKTAMVSRPSAFGDSTEAAGFSIRQEEHPFPEHQTLMGMSLSDFGPPKPAAEPDEEPPRSTQFGIPAVQKPTAPPKVDLDSGPISAEVNDSPTEMWNPMSEIAATEAQSDRKALLEKLRKGVDAPNKTTTEEHIKPGGQVLPVGPAAGIVPSIPAPNIDAGDLRARLQAKLKASSLDSGPISPTALPKPEPVKPQPVAPLEPPARTEAPGAAIGRIQLTPKQVSPQPEPVPSPVREGVLFSPDSDEDDFAFADTGIAPADLVSKLQQTPAAVPAAAALITPARVDGRPTDIFDQIQPNQVQPNTAPTPQAPVFPDAPLPRTPAFPEPPAAQAVASSVAQPVVAPAAEPGVRSPAVTPMPPVEPSPTFGLATTPEASSIGMVPESSVAMNDDVGPVWLQRIPALIGGLMLLLPIIVVLLKETDLIQKISAGAFAVTGFVLIAVTLSGPPNTLRRVIWGALGALVGCVFSLYLMLFGMIPAAMGIPAFCGGLFALAAAAIRLLYSKTS